jgi:hypothetical protein
MGGRPSAIPLVAFDAGFDDVQIAAAGALRDRTGWNGVYAEANPDHTRRPDPKHLIPVLKQTVVSLKV